MNDATGTATPEYPVNFTVIGAGALGTFYAAMLSASGFTVTLVCREKDVATLEKGIRITGLLERTARPAISTVPPASGPVLVTVKTYDIPSAVRGIPLGPDTLVVVIHNGLGGDVAATAVLGPGHVAAGVSYSGATFLEPGVVRLAGLNGIVLGSVEPEVRARLPVVAEAMGKAGLKARVDDDIRAAQWEKLYANVGINAITAITGRRNGEILAIPALRELAVSAVEEAARVSRALKIHSPIDPVGSLLEVIRDTAENRSSMLQDILRGKRTEIDAMNGMIRDLGRNLGIPTPCNDALAALVNGIEHRGKTRDATERKPL